MATWFVQYVFILAALCLYYSGSPEQDRRKAMLNSCRLIVAAMFFWSGVQKLNFSFVNRLFPSLIGPYLKFLFGSFSFLRRVLILGVPLLEISIGVGLLTRRFRDVAVVAAVIMHIFILMLLVPVKLNSIVWPWNAAMASFVVILFWRDRGFSASEVLLPRKLSFQIVVLILFGTMPLFSFFGLWDSYLSAALYSGNVPNAVIYVSEATRERLPPAIQNQVRPAAMASFKSIHTHGLSLNSMPPVIRSEESFSMLRERSVSTPLIPPQ